jgi:hypothetical protein
MENDYLQRIEFTNIGLVDIQNWLGVKPLVETMFVFQNNKTMEFETTLQPMKNEGITEWDQISFPLEMIVEPSKHGYQVRINQFPKEMVSKERVHEIFQVFEHQVHLLLNSMVGCNLPSGMKSQ